MSNIPIKSPREIEKMRQAGQAASEILEKVGEFLRPGVMTREVDQYAAELIAAAGCKSAFLGYRGFPGNICISINEQVVHGIGGARRIQYGDIVKLDIGVFKDGWVGDTAKTVPVGIISAGDAETFAGDRGSPGTRHPVRAGGQPAARRVGDHRKATSSSTGSPWCASSWATGSAASCTRNHRCPTTRRATTRSCAPGMTLAIEPMVNMGTADVKVLGDDWTVVTADGRPSAHFEHTVLVTKGEPEILTWREKMLSK